MKLIDLNDEIMLGKERKERKLMGKGEKNKQRTHKWFRGPIEKKKSTHGSLVFRKRVVNKMF
jgi:hypothetical protein